MELVEKIDIDFVESRKESRCESCKKVEHTGIFVVRSD